MKWRISCSSLLEMHCKEILSDNGAVCCRVLKENLTVSPSARELCCGAVSSHHTASQKFRNAANAGLNDHEALAEVEQMKRALNTNVSGQL